MDINLLKINNFGKIKNKEIKLEKNINLIYGKNESGKTTILKFILGMFYGVSKNKNGKSFSDFEKYKPWESEEFSGKIQYTLSNNEQYEVFREFKKQNPKIYSNMVDVSKEYSTDKTIGNQFFFEQTGIDEETFSSTLAIEQQKVVINEKSQNILIQKIINILSTGEENISYKKTLEKLNKKLIEEVGTERTTGRPLNIINEKIEKNRSDKKLLEENTNKKEEIEKNKNNLSNKINEIKNTINLLKRINEKNKINNLENEKIKINEELKNNYENKINNLENKLKEKSKNKINLIILLFLFILNILINLIKMNKMFRIFSIVILSIYLIYFLINKLNKKSEFGNIEKEIKIIKNSLKEKEEEINSIKNNLNSKNIVEDKNIINDFINQINIEEINKFLKLGLEESNIELEKIQNEFNRLNLELNKLEVEYKYILEILDKKSFIDENLTYLLEEKDRVLSLSNSIVLAKESLEAAYNKMKDEVNPQFTKELSTIANKISEKYSNIKFVDGEGLVVEMENGEYVSAEKLSIGTIDQLYLSLRLSAMEKISTEKMPIIFDESFVYFDTRRLENIFKYLSSKNTERQIIILSCSEREKQAMDKLGINYNYINLEDI